MGFNPLKEKGIPIEKQLRNWSTLNVKPYDKHQVHPYTRTRIIFMNGIEVEGAMFTHQFARHTDDLDLKRKLAMSRRVEQQQQKVVNWLIPPDESVLEVTIGYEQVAVDLTSFLARTEPDKYVKAALDFALLEDFDHLYRYANLMHMVQGKKAEEVTGPYTEITVGRPTIVEHRHPFDEVRKPYNGKSAEFLTKLHVLTIVAAEQQTMNFYMNVGNQPKQELGRGLYLEIAQIEEQHVTHYESLADPNASWFERLVLHEYNECWLYHSLMQEEPDKQVRSIWQQHLDMEVEHLRIACDLMKEYTKQDPEKMLPSSMPEPLSFHSNVEYVREILESQVDYNAQLTEFVPGDQVEEDSRYYKYQEMVNEGGAPSEEVIEKHIAKKGSDYRQELQEGAMKEPQRRRPMHDDFFEVLKNDHEEVKGIMEKLKDSSGEKERVDLLNKLKEEIEPHMEAEENVFYSVLTDEEESKDHALEAIEEHHVAKMVLRELDKNNKAGDRWKAKMSVFKELVEHHIEEEEGEIFESAQKVLSEDQLLDILERFNDVKKKAKSSMK